MTRINADVWALLSAQEVLILMDQGMPFNRIPINPRLRSDVRIEVARLMHERNVELAPLGHVFREQLQTEIKVANLVKGAA